MRGTEQQKRDEMGRQKGAKQRNLWDLLGFIHPLIKGKREVTGR